MASLLLLHTLAAVICLLIKPIASFSHGASHRSCLKMIPGHIQAHPLDPKHSHVTIHTSSSLYWPGQLITVTVRSSRDFMGFLLQARSRLGPILVGGCWILTPPSTHTLHCMSDGDTVTHSDKQLKRNLSFVWRAPDAPMGDVRFHITVVQSYFVYWAGIESAVVHDGSRETTSAESTAATLLTFQGFHEVKTLSSSIHHPRTSTQAPKTSWAFRNQKKTKELYGTNPTGSQTAETEASSHSSQHGFPSFLHKPYSSISAPTSANRQPTVKTFHQLETSPTGPKSSSERASWLKTKTTQSTSTQPRSSSPIQTQSFVTFYPLNPPIFTLDKGLGSQSKVKSSDDLHSSPSSFLHSSILQSTETMHLPPSGSPTLVSTPPSVRPTLSIHLSSLKSQPETVPALSALPIPSPRPSKPQTPGEDGKYPDIVPKHTAWELGVLLGGSAGFGMVLVLAVRCLYRQACGRRTAVTLNDREREYGRGEIGLIQVQECGDLVRVRKIRENSFVFLTEYDVLATSGN
uniref:Reelin domain-containing protein n=1 Tax=Oryzias latipes TaxID=8090 RepID=A0A3B3IKD6_ORYLA